MPTTISTETQIFHQTNSECQATAEEDIEHQATKEPTYAKKYFRTVLVKACLKLKTQSAKP